MSKTIVVLGNGFDLDLGLNTNYSDFAKSQHWTELMDNNVHSKDDTRLLGFLKKKYDIEQWVDLEGALLDFATVKTKNHDFNNADEDACDFASLCLSLRYYLKDQQDLFKPFRHSVASEYLKYLSFCSNQSCLYSFNYTQLNLLAQKCNINMGYDAKHIHGSLRENDNIILGIETREYIDEHYSFLFKTQNRKYKHSNLLKDLRGKDEYVFFGHSLNGMDYAYFDSTFIQLSNNNLDTPRLTIITKDEKEENKFKNFLRKKHISLQGLFSNSDPCIILTDAIYKNDREELLKFSNLIERAKVM